MAASPAKVLMDLYYDLGREYKSNNNFTAGLVFDECENMVNNLMHGRAFSDIYPQLRNIFLQNRDADYTDEDARQYYDEAILWLDEAAREYA